MSILSLFFYFYLFFFHCCFFIFFALFLNWHSSLLFFSVCVFYLLLFLINDSIFWFHLLAGVTLLYFIFFGCFWFHVCIFLYFCFYLSDFVFIICGFHCASCFCLLVLIPFITIKNCLWDLASRIKSWAWAQLVESRGLLCQGSRPSENSWPLGILISQNSQRSPLKFNIQYQSSACSI